MRGRRSALKVELDEQDKAQLVRWLRAQNTPFGLARRAWAVLLVAGGQSLAGAGRQVGMAERHVRKWVRRFMQQGVAGLSDAHRSGRPPVFSPRGGSVFGQDGQRIT